MLALWKTPQKRIISGAGLSWLIVRELQALLTLLTMPKNPVASWYFWDAGYYVGIARHGYTLQAGQLAAYFPLYPMLAHVLILGQFPWPAAMLIVSNAGMLAALCLVGLLVYHETGKEAAALWAVLLLAVSPLGVFLSGMYPDGLFIALVAGAFLAARSEHWRVAGLVLAMAIITRPFGLALVVALLLEGLRQRQQWRQFLWLLGPSLVTGGIFLLVLWYTYGSPGVTFSVERSDFGHAFTWPWQTLWLTVQQFINLPGLRAHIALDATPLLIGALYVAVMANRVPRSFSVYVAAVVLLCLVSPVVSALGQYAIVSDGRYCYAAAPLLLIPVGSWLAHRPQWVTSGLVALSLAVQLGLVVFELHGGWLV